MRAVVVCEHTNLGCDAGFSVVPLKHEEERVYFPFYFFEFADVYCGLFSAACFGIATQGLPSPDPLLTKEGGYD